MAEIRGDDKISLRILKVRFQYPSDLFRLILPRLSDEDRDEFQIVSSIQISFQLSAADIP